MCMFSFCSLNTGSCVVASSYCIESGDKSFLIQVRCLASSPKRKVNIVGNEVEN